MDISLSFAINPKTSFIESQAKIEFSHHNKNEIFVLNKNLSIEDVE